MTESLLNECCESILKIAETQPPVGKMAISMMAEMFCENSGRAARDGQLHRRKTSKRLIGSRYLFVGAPLRVMH
ncbi:MAG TPA: hypothetical protein VN926_06970 [Bradyrhizobium sp.]|nr:hypothetical protein [Bradyrhizobium sp.]